MKHPTKRFTPTWWSEHLVPALLIILLLGLVAAIVLIALSVLGVLPGT
jgi:hypothetical protein